jgi:transposase
LKRTLQLLWAEYKEAASEPTRCYQYTQFCQHYHAWAGTLEPMLRQVHVAGERLFVDYAGPTMPIVDPQTGEIREAQIFVGVGELRVPCDGNPPLPASLRAAVN